MAEIRTEEILSESAETDIISEDTEIAETVTESSAATATKNKKSIKRKVKEYIKAHLYNLPQTKAENRRNPESEKPRVIISGRNYSSNLCLARSFGKAGYEVEILRIFHRKPTRSEPMKQMKPDAYSKYIKAYYECVTNNKNYNIKNRLIELADKDRKMLLIPADDLVASAADRYYDELKEYYHIPNINDEAGALRNMMEKVRQTELAREAGLPVVNSCLITVKKGGKVKIPETVNFPCFIKPNVSKNGSKGKMKKVETRKELIATLKEYSRTKKIEFLVEDFLNIKRECSLLGLSTKDGVVIPGFFAAEKGGHGAHRGVALTGRILPTSQQQELIDKIGEFVGTIGYTGLFDVDLIETEEGKMYFVELNLRYGGSGYAVTQCGANLPGMFADYMLMGKPIDLECTVKETDKTFVSEKIAIDELEAGYMTREEMEEVISSADINFIKDENDPAAFEHFVKYYDVAEKQSKNRESAEYVAKHGNIFKRTKRKLKRNVKKVYRKAKHKLLGLPQTKAENRRNPESEKPRVVISGRNYCSNLSLARAFGQAGYEVEIIRVFAKKPRLRSVMKMLKPDAYSKYVKAYNVCVTNNNNYVLKNMLISLADENRKMLLIPADDLVANAVDRYYDELADYYLMPNINDEAHTISAMMEKARQTSLAREAGLPVVNSCVVRIKKGSEIQIPETVTYPCFIKPNVSIKGLKTKMKKCETEEELIEALNKNAKKKKVSYLVEDFIDIKRECSLLGLSTKDGVVIPGFFAADIGGNDSRRGVALTGTVLPVEDHKPLVDGIRNFVQSIGYEGLFDIDLIEAQDGTIYFVELNLRYGGSGYAITESGANLPGMFADYMLMGKPIDLDCAVKETGKTFISEKIMLEEYMHSFITKQQMKKLFSEADIHFVYNEDDMAPYNHFKKFYPVAGLMRKYYNR
ncbi:MAG: ATP-grasp domain-containing protein [Oscillospiraceae bacterium]|nr:ATP-grasp domain-containing protein [Oscillospiraceae bacterium]